MLSDGAGDRSAGDDWAEGDCACDDRADDMADDRTVRALVVPVLEGLDRAASEHSPTAEQSGVTVTVTGPAVSTGMIAPCLVIYVTISADALALLPFMKARSLTEADRLYNSPPVTSAEANAMSAAAPAKKTERIVSVLMERVMFESDGIVLRQWKEN